MLPHNKIKLFLLIVFVSSSTVAGQILGNVIHEHLIPCYRGNNTQPWIGNSFQLFLEIIRKIEDANPTSIDIRRLSVNIMHQLRVDGIERSLTGQENDLVIPFGVIGDTSSPKYSILLELISNIPGHLNFTSFLSQDDICHLHSVISSTIERHSRGDESRTCPITLLNSSLQQTSSAVSRCPIERGVIRSNDFGTISPGTIIASIAAGLQPQKVSIGNLLHHNSENFKNLETMDSDPDVQFSRLLSSTDTIDNQFAAGLSGDLAEVCVFQGPIFGTNMTVGLSGSWNDTLYPRVRYFPQGHNLKWEMPNSEILAGIDGLFLSQQIESWNDRIGRLRLSQVIDMFYSSRGIPTINIENMNRGNTPVYMGRRKVMPIAHLSEFDELINWNDGINRACHRGDIIGAIDIEQLKNEVFQFSKVLQLNTPSVVVSDEVLRRHCDFAVDQFFDNAKILLDTLPTCGQIVKETKQVSIDLTVVIDGSRRTYENLQLINHIAEISDVSSYNSQITIINGASGNVMVNKTRSISTTFSKLRNFTDEFPQTLSLSASLATIVRLLQNESDHEKQNRIMGSNSQVVLIMSQSSRITEHDYESARRMLSSSFLQFPDVYFVFVTNNAGSFKDLISQLNDSHKNQLHRYTIITADSIDPSTFTNELLNLFKKIPRRMMSPFCSDGTIAASTEITSRDQYEQYLSPDVEMNYRVAPYYLRGVQEAQFEVHGYGYGDFTVCLSRQPDYMPLECKTIVDLGSAYFNLTQPCQDVSNCNGVYFSVMMDSTRLRCTENDCRHPDDIRFIFRHFGLRCDYQNSSTSTVHKLYLPVIIIISIIYYVFI